jgi:hypothetical protein
MNCLPPLNGIKSDAVFHLDCAKTFLFSLFPPSSEPETFRRVYIREVLRMECLNMRKK